MDEQRAAAEYMEGMERLRAVIANLALYIGVGSADTRGKTNTEVIAMVQEKGFPSEIALAFSEALLVWTIFQTMWDDD